MNLQHPAAFQPFYDESAVVTGERREAGASSSRPLKLTASCCVIEGGPVDATANAVTPMVEFAFSVLIRRDDWKEPVPPQKGDILTIDNRPVMRCARCHQMDGDWVLDCRSKAAPQ